jgi:hypothetical protein
LSRKYNASGKLAPDGKNAKIIGINPEATLASMIRKTKTKSRHAHNGWRHGSTQTPQVQITDQTARINRHEFLTASRNRLAKKSTDKEKWAKSFPLTFSSFRSEARLARQPIHTDLSQVEIASEYRASFRYLVETSISPLYGRLDFVKFTGFGPFFERLSSVVDREHTGLHIPLTVRMPSVSAMRSIVLHMMPFRRGISNPRNFFAEHSQRRSLLQGISTDRAT